jgi:hypothetical protein
MAVISRIIVATTISCFIGACSTAEKDWEKAQQQDTVESYETFLKEYGGSTYAYDAKVKIRELKTLQRRKTAFEKARDSKSLSACEQFLREYGSGRDSDEIREQLSQLVFDTLEGSNSENKYEKFLSRFPNSELVSKARSRLREIRYANAIEEVTVTAYEKFIAQYPDGADSADLRNRLQKLKNWERSKHGQLGEIALQMAPTATMQMVVSPWGRGRAENGGPRLEQSPNLKKDLIAFKKLLDSGADPKRVHIRGFTPSGTVLENGITFFSFGSKGYAVPAESGGITLLEYFKANNLKEAYDLLKHHNGNQ